MEIKTTLVLGFFLASSAVAFGAEYTRARIGSVVWDIAMFETGDYFPDDDAIIPFVKQDSMRDNFSEFITDGGWTTNQVVGAIASVYSNAIDRAASDDSDDSDDGYYSMMSCISLRVIGRINHPSARDFLAATITNDTRSLPYVSEAVVGLFRYSAFDENVMEFMRNLCVDTNIYRRTSITVPYRMIECATNLPPEQSGAAITNVSKFLHFSLFHLTSNICYTEKELMSITPEYSNSVQRLAVMRYVAATATNNFERANASNIVERLSAMPTNELNNIEWITQ